MARQAFRLLAAVSAASVLLHLSIQLWGVGGNLGDVGWWTPIDSLLFRWHRPRSPRIGWPADDAAAALNVTPEWPGGGGATAASASLTPPTLDPGARFVTGYIGIGRLGNNMFVYASVMGVALRHNLSVAYCLSDWQLAYYDELRSLFRVTVAAARCSFAQDRSVVEKGWGVYNRDVDNTLLFGRRTFVNTYLQSHKYFDAYRRQVAREFELTPPYAALADGFLRRAASGHANVTFVGVHVRRGDMVARDLYNVAPESYIGRAMDSYRAKYGGSGGGGSAAAAEVAAAAAALVFVVASDDLAWVRAALARLNSTSSDVAYAGGESAAGDLAILSRCNHSIVTSGTYGWWAAWLAGGDVVYYRNFMPNSSRLAADYAPDDYYPRSWIGLD